MLSELRICKSNYAADPFGVVGVRPVVVGLLVRLGSKLIVCTSAELRVTEEEPRTTVERVDFQARHARKRVNSRASGQKIRRKQFAAVHMCASRDHVVTAVESGAVVCSRRQDMDELSLTCRTTIRLIELRDLIDGTTENRVAVRETSR